MTVLSKPKTSEAARGKWRGILMTLGVQRSVLSGKHGPCPFPQCGGGKDRFRFDDKDGSGSFICSGCGAGTGFEFLKRLNGWEFAEAAREVDKVVGNVRAEPVQAAITPERRREMLNRLWSESAKITAGDPVLRYFAGRNILPPGNCDVLRYAPDCPVPGGATCPAMIAKVQAPDGSAATLHRTFLGPNGKADMAHPRASMPGEIPDGSAIRLCNHRERLGIAEGIETALAASTSFDMPVWAAINATMLAKWQPPEGVTEVWIFADNDDSFTGHAAAYALAHRLRVRDKLTVHVEIPAQVGTDWADMLEDAA